MEQSSAIYQAKLTTANHLTLTCHKCHHWPVNCSGIRINVTKFMMSQCLGHPNVPMCNTDKFANHKNLILSNKNKLRMYLLWSLCTLFILPCQLRVTTDDSGLCHAPCYVCSICLPLFADSTQTLWASFCIRLLQFTQRQSRKRVYVCIYTVQKKKKCISGLI